MNDDINEDVKYVNNYIENLLKQVNDRNNRNSIEKRKDAEIGALKYELKYRVDSLEQRLDDLVDYVNERNDKLVEELLDAVHSSENEAKTRLVNLLSAEALGDALEGLAVRLKPKTE